MPVSKLFIGQPRSAAAAVSVGLAAGLGQVVVLRELMVLAGGNELSLGLGLGGWLLWAAAGSFTSSCLFNRPFRAALPLFLVGAGGGASLILARAAPSLLGLHLGVVPSWGQILTVSLIVLGPLGWADGAAFPLILAAGGQSRVTSPRLLAWLYGVEALGHTAAAALFALVLVKWLNPVAVVSGAALLGALVALKTASGRSRRLMLVWAAALIIACLLSKPADHSLRLCQWRGRDLAGFAESPYAQLVATRGQGQVDFFASGLWLFSQPNRERLERSAVLPLLARPEARRVLFIGGAAEGVAAEAARRGKPDEVLAVELDPWLVDFAARLLPEQTPPPGLSIKIGDGRVFLKKTDQRFDLIVLETPPPVTMQMNRFYSREGFAAMAKALRPAGVAALSLPGAESLIGPLQARWLGSILAAARTSFSEVAVMSGPELRLFLSNAPLPEEPRMWQERLARRAWSDLTAVRPDTLEWEMNPLRLALLRAMIQQAGPQAPNSDLRPRALILDPQLWGAQLGGRSSLAESLAGLKPGHLWWPLLIAAGLFFAAATRPRFGPLGLFLGVFTTGLTSMALSVLLLLAFQTLFGAVYVGLAVLLAGFMFGLAAAAVMIAWDLWPLKPGTMSLMILTGLLILACLATWALVALLLASKAGSLGALALVAAAVLDGGLTGAYFGSAGRVRLTSMRAGTDSPPAPPLAREGGKLYGLDLIGGLAGAILPMILVPTVGLGAALMILSLVNLIPLAGLAGRLTFGAEATSLR